MGSCRKLFDGVLGIWRRDRMGGAEFEELGESLMVLLQELQGSESLATLQSPSCYDDEIYRLRDVWWCWQQRRTALLPAHARFVLLLGWVRLLHSGHGSEPEDMSYQFDNLWVVGVAYCDHW